MIHTLKIVGLTALMCLFLMACGQDKYTNTSMQIISFTVIKSGLTDMKVNSQSLKSYVFSTPSGWETFWKQHNRQIPVSPAPKVDFNTNLIIFVIDKDQPSSGYELTVDKIGTVDANLYIYVTQTQPGPNCMTLSEMTQPYAIIQLNNKLIKDKVPGHTPIIKLNTVTHDCK